MKQCEESMKSSLVDKLKVGDFLIWQAEFPETIFGIISKIELETQCCHILWSDIGSTGHSFMTMTRYFQENKTKLL